MDRFNSTIQFINGATNLLPDSLSRRPELCTPSPLEERIVFGPELTTSGTDKKVHVIEQLATGNLEDQVINSQSACPEFPRLNGLAKSNPNHKTFAMINNVLLMNNLIWVPKSERSKVLFDYHDHILAGYPGQSKTLSLIKRTFYCPGITQDKMIILRNVLPASDQNHPK